jgi:ribosomal protein S19
VHVPSSSSPAPVNMKTIKNLRTTQLIKFISKRKQKTSNKTIKTHLNGVIVVPSNL